MLNVDKTTATSDLFMDLNQKDAETISGGYEVFQITNNTNYNVGLNIDGTSFINRPGETWTYTAHGGGIINFDTDGRGEYAQWKKYNLADGGVYEFADNNFTPGNPYDIDLYV